MVLHNLWKLSLGGRCELQGFGLSDVCGLVGLRQFRGGLGDLLFFGSDFALHFLYVFCCREVLGTDASRSKHLTDCAVVLDVLGGDGGFALEVFLVNVVIGHLGGEVLGRNGEGGQESHRRLSRRCSARVVSRMREGGREFRVGTAD